MKGCPFDLFKMEKLKLISSNRSFGGTQRVYSHDSAELSCSMKFAIYFPPQADFESGSAKLPVVYWLSGLTCTEENFIFKAGAQRYAAELGLVIVCPDTSPRGLGIPGEDDSYDFGTGAGFYVDAVEEPWKKNYRMFSYIASELVDIVSDAFGNVVDVTRQGIMGHSMGGHGALVCALKCPALYKSVSAFAPICNPMNCPWGRKAFNGYLGPDEKTWKEWDATELVSSYNGPPLLLYIDQGTADNFYKDKQLLPENLVEACRNANFPIILKMREDYDHSYYYIATFIGEHLEHHAKVLYA